MHEIIQTSDGWVQVFLRDDSGSHDARLDYMRRDERYLAIIVWEEHKQDKLDKHYSVKGVVYRNTGNGGSNGWSNGSHHTLDSTLFLNKGEFKGERSKEVASRYGYALQQKIDFLYFPAEQQPS